MTAEHAVSPEEGRGRAVGRAALILMLGNLVGSALGFARQIAITKVFGANLHTDAFFAASVVPQMFYDLVIGAAVSAALIPTFSEIVGRRGREGLWEVLGPVLAFAWVLLAAVVIVLVIAAQPFMSAVMWGYHVKAGAKAAALPLVVEQARILIPTVFFLGTSALLLAALYSLRRFTVPAFAPSLYHVGVIGGAVFLARPLGILALPIGALAGASCQAATQGIALWRQRPSIHLRLALTPELRQIIRLYAPVAAGLLVSIAGQIIDLGFKSHLRASAITVMAQATTLTQFPIGIAVAALAFAVLPSISTDAAFARIEEYKDTLAAGIRFVLFLTIPAAVGYLALATPISSLVFQHGKVTAADTALIATALLGYAIQIPFVGLDQMLIFSFYARKDTLTPMLVGVVGVGIYVLSALILMPRYQIFGLALANSIQNSLHGLILLALLFLTAGTLGGRGIPGALARALASAVVMGAGIGFLARALATLVNPNPLLGQAVVVLVPIAAGTVMYLGLASLLGSEEVGVLWRTVRRLNSRTIASNPPARL